MDQQWEVADEGTGEEEWVVDDAAPASPADRFIPQGAPAPYQWPTEGGPIDPRGLATGAIGLSRIATGPGQVVTGVAQMLSGRPDLVKQYTDTVAALEAKVAGGEPLTPEEEQAASMVGLIGGAAIPVGTMGTATKLLPGLAKSAAAGATGGSLAFDPNAETTWDALRGPTVGAGGALLLGLPIGLWQAGRNFLFRGFRDAPTPEQAQNIADMEASALTKDAPLSNAQRTGRYEAEVAEARVAGTKAQDFYNSQLNNLGNMFRRASRPGRTPADMATDAQNAINATRAKMQSRASKDYEAGIDRARALAKGDVADSYGIRANNVVEEMRKLPPADTWSKHLDSSTRKYLDEYNTLIDKLNSQGGVLGMADMIQLHRVATRWQQGLKNVTRGKDVPQPVWDAIRAGGGLRKAIERDVETMATKLRDLRASGQIPPNMKDAGKGYEAAWKEFEATRDGYRNFKQSERYLENSALIRAFGKGASADAAAQWDKLMRMEPAEQIRTMNILRAGSPRTIADLKAWRIREVANNMIDFTVQGGKSPVSVDKFIAQLTEGERLVGSELWSARELNDLRGALAYARTIQNKAAVRQQTADPEGTFMALASRSTAFVARAMYRIVANKKAEELFFTPEGIKALRTLATTNDYTSRAAQGAIGYLSALAAKGEGTDEYSTAETEGAFD